MAQANEKNIWYQSNFELFEKSLNGEAKSGLHRLRRNAIARFNEIGFPTTRHEEWRFTNVAPIAKTNFKPVLKYRAEGVTTADVARFTFAKKNVIVFVNGHFSRELSVVESLPHGVVTGSLASALETHGDLVNRHLTKLAKYKKSC